MIGYKKWSEVLSKAAAEPDFKQKMLSDWDAVAKPAIDGAVAWPSDGDDQKLMQDRFRAALSDISPSNTPKAQLFYAMGNFEVLDPVRILKCPFDCISRKNLNDIADTIFDHDSVTIIQGLLLAWGLIHIPWSADDNQRRQFNAIVANVGPGPLVIPVESLSPCKPT